MDKQDQCSKLLPHAMDGVDMTSGFENDFKGIQEDTDSSEKFVESVKKNTVNG